MAKREPRSSTKYKNIVGSAFPNFVKEQIEARKKLVGKKTRNSDETLWLTNRVGWSRLSSGAKVKSEGADIPENVKQDILSNVSYRGESFLESNSFPSEAARTGAAGLQASRANRQLALEQDKLYTTDLAKANVLQGGTISISETKDLDGSVKFQANRKTQFNELYKQGATDQLGLKPMPGITSISVGTGGKWQTLLQADVEFICHDLDQLDLMSKLYMSLGVHVFLEWGHSPYVDKDGNLLKSNEPIDYFSTNSTKELLQKVTEKKEQTGGNYGALVGRVYNFDFEANNDGSYNCKIQIMGPGGMLESLRINKSSRIDFDIINPTNHGHKYSSDLHNALYSIKNFLLQSNISLNSRKKTFITTGANTVNIESGTNNFGIIDENKFFEPLVAGKEATYGDLLNKIYNTCNYKGPQFNPQNPSIIDYRSDFTKFGNAWQIISNFASISPSENSTDRLDPLPISLFYGFSTRFSQGASVYRNLYGIPTGDESFEAEYITFGHLLCLIQHISVFVYGKDRDEATKYNAKQRAAIELTERQLGRSSGLLGNTYNAILYIDYHPDNTKVLTGPLEASLDPGVCMVPLSMNSNKDVPGDDPIKSFGRMLKPLDTMNSKVSKWDTDKAVPNIDRNLIYNDLGNKINESIRSTSFPSKYDGKLHNVLINLDFAINELKRLSNGDQDVNLIEYVNAILDGVNVSLGKVNNFRAFFDDCSSVLRIIDENLTEEITEDSLLEIPNYGLQSVTYDYSYSSKVSPKLASQIVIASQAADKGGIQNFPEDVLTYNKLNDNVRDRFSEIIISPIEVRDTSSEEIEKLKATQKLFDDIYNIYSLNELINGTSSYINLYADLQNVSRKYYSTKNTNLVIPLVFSIEMDGIDGILPYNAFKIPDDRLPKRYRGKVAFAVFNINHNFSSNNWTTTLNGQTILINPTYIIDDRPNSTGEITPPPVTRTPQQPLETTTYGAKLDLPLPTADFTIPTSPKAQPEEEDTTVVPEEPLTPTADTPQPITPLIINPEPARIPEDILKARDFIIPLESPGGIPELTAYKDIDYTVAAGFTYRIGFGSDTITSTTGGVRRVKEGDTIISDQAYLDIERRLKTDFKPRVVTTCEANGVNYDSLPSVVKTVLIDCAYNYGSLWNSIVISYRDGGVPGLIAELQRRANRGASQVPRRREAEIRHLGG